MPAFRVRLVAAVAAFVVVAACGGDESQPEPAADASPTSEATPDESTRTDVQEPDQPTAAVSRMQLGDRFEVCGEVQAAWDAFADALPVYEAAQSAVRDAEAAVASATDDLDRAEANEALSEADRTLRQAEELYTSARWEAFHDLLMAMSAHEQGGDSSRTVVNARAWEAFVAAADSETLAAINGVGEAIEAQEEATAAAAAAAEAYDAAHEQALQEAEAALEQANDVYEAWQRAFLDEHDISEYDEWLVVYPESPEGDAAFAAREHLEAVREQETAELIALRETAASLDDTASFDASRAVRTAQTERETAMRLNAETATPAYRAFQRSFVESCR